MVRNHDQADRGFALDNIGWTRKRKSCFPTSLTSWSSSPDRNKCSGMWRRSINFFKGALPAIAVIAVAPTGKASFVNSYVLPRPMGLNNRKRPFSLVYVLKPLITAIRAIATTTSLFCSMNHMSYIYFCHEKTTMTFSYVLLLFYLMLTEFELEVELSFNRATKWDASGQFKKGALVSFFDRDRTAQHVVKLGSVQRIMWWWSAAENTGPRQWRNSRK